MRLTDHTDYSLRVLMYLNQEKKLINLNELSERLGISRNNLIKVSNQLSKLGLIETSLGRNGGLSIREEAGKKTLKEIILCTEETFHIAECFSEKKCDCTFIRNCGLKKSLMDAFHSFLNTLHQKTLNDVTPVRSA